MHESKSMNFNSVSFEKKLKRISRRCKKRDIHAFRVDYKRVRALFDVMNMESKKNQKTLSVIRKIYHLAGLIRDRQVEKENLKEYLSGHTVKLQYYQKLVQKRIKKHKRQLQYFIESHKKMSVEWKRIDLAVSLVSIADLELYVINSIKKIADLRQSGNFTDARLHQIRKILKNIWYTLLFMDDINYGNSNLKSFEERYRSISLYKIMNSLGELHDLVIIVNVLETDLSKEEFSGTAKNTVFDLLRFQKNKKQELKSECIDQLSDFSLPEIEQLMMRSLQ